MSEIKTHRWQSEEGVLTLARYSSNSLSVILQGSLFFSLSAASCSMSSSFSRYGSIISSKATMLHNNNIMIKTGWQNVWILTVWDLNHIWVLFLLLLIVTVLRHPLVRSSDRRVNRGSKLKQEVSVKPVVDVIGLLSPTCLTFCSSLVFTDVTVTIL